MTYAPISPIALEGAIDRMGADLQISRDVLLDVLLPAVLEWAITRTSADLGVTSREARARIARMTNRPHDRGRRPTNRRSGPGSSKRL